MFATSNLELMNIPTGFPVTRGPLQYGHGKSALLPEHRVDLPQGRTNPTHGRCVAPQNAPVGL